MLLWTLILKRIQSVLRSARKHQLYIKEPQFTAHEYTSVHIGFSCVQLGHKIDKGSCMGHMIGYKHMRCCVKGRMTVAEADSLIDGSMVWCEHCQDNHPGTEFIWLLDENVKTTVLVRKKGIDGAPKDYAVCAAGRVAWTRDMFEATQFACARSAVLATGRGVIVETVEMIATVKTITEI